MLSDAADQRALETGTGGMMKRERKTEAEEVMRETAGCCKQTEEDRKAIERERSGPEILEKKSVMGQRTEISEITSTQQQNAVVSSLCRA